MNTTNDKVTFDCLPELVLKLSQEVKELRQLILSDTNKMTAEVLDELMDVGQAAQLLGLSKQTIYGKVSRREIPFMKRGKKLYFYKLELMDYLKSGRVKTFKEISLSSRNYLAA
ncbi:helix-turn-helix domain-containing protein [Vicingaceae bacterium]|nr:helix-turn-helix domain-containing protein [Vicingaceae bacterium]